MLYQAVWLALLLAVHGTPVYIVLPLSVLSMVARMFNGSYNFSSEFLVYFSLIIITCSMRHNILSCYVIHVRIMCISCDITKTC